jgi:hypothetical protein
MADNLIEIRKFCLNFFLKIQAVIYFAIIQTKEIRLAFFVLKGKMCTFCWKKIGSKGVFKMMVKLITEIFKEKTHFRLEFLHAL